MVLGPLGARDALTLLEASSGREPSVATIAAALDLARRSVRCPEAFGSSGSPHGNYAAAFASLTQRFRTGDEIVRALIASRPPLEVRILRVLALARAPASCHTTSHTSCATARSTPACAISRAANSSGPVNRNLRSLALCRRTRCAAGPTRIRFARESSPRSATSAHHGRPRPCSIANSLPRKYCSKSWRCTRNGWQVLAWSVQQLGAKLRRPRRVRRPGVEAAPRGRGSGGPRRRCARVCFSSARTGHPRRIRAAIPPEAQAYLRAAVADRRAIGDEDGAAGRTAGDFSCREIGDGTASVPAAPRSVGRSVALSRRRSRPRSDPDRAAASAFPTVRLLASNGAARLGARVGSCSLHWSWHHPETGRKADRTSSDVRLPWRSRVDSVTALRGDLGYDHFHRQPAAAGARASSPVGDCSRRGGAGAQRASRPLPPLPPAYGPGGRTRLCYAVTGAHGLRMTPNSTEAGSGYRADRTIAAACEPGPVILIPADRTGKTARRHPSRVCRRRRRERRAARPARARKARRSARDPRIQRDAARDRAWPECAGLRRRRSCGQRRFDPAWRAAAGSARCFRVWPQTTTGTGSPSPPSTPWPCKR